MCTVYIVSVNVIFSVYLEIFYIIMCLLLKCERGLEFRLPNRYLICVTEMELK